MRNWNKPEPKYTEENKAKLNVAFKRFRKELRALARQNYLCCMSCGSAAGWDFIAKHPGKYDALIFYHAQDAEGMRKDGDVNLRFSTKDGGDDCRVLGEKMVAILRSEGLKVDWNGDAGTCIGVDLREESAEQRAS